MAEEGEGLGGRLDGEHEREDVGEWEDTEGKGQDDPSRCRIVLVEDVEEEQRCRDCQVELKGIEQEVYNPVG